MDLQWINMREESEDRLWDWKGLVVAGGPRDSRVVREYMIAA